MSSARDIVARMEARQRRQPVATVAVNKQVKPVAFRSFRIVAVEQQRLRRWHSAGSSSMGRQGMS